MGQINIGRVVTGGLLAGLVINVGESILNLAIIAEDAAAAMEALGLPPIGGSAAMVFVVFGFLIGIATVWLYAAVRPRFGPGPKTALLVGVVVWALVWLWPSVGDGMINLAPPRLLMTAVVWQLVEMALAALLGASIYKETTAQG